MRCQAPSLGGSDAGVSCVQNCLGKLGTVERSVRLDVARSLGTCYDGLACGVSDDGCTTAAFKAIVGGALDAAIHAPDVTACLAKNEACKATSTDTSVTDIDDVCAVLPLLVDEKRTELAKCFDRPCSEVTACTGN